MQTTISIQKAGSKDFDKICQLLSEEKLPTEDLNPLLEHFFVAVEENEITGVIGMDKYGNAGLLRSAIVTKAHRNSGIATALVDQLFDYAKQQQVSTLYLISNTAEKYFEKRGFHRIERNEVPETVLQSKEFNGLCPTSSVIMTRKL
jgi:amino-acid N-acetyltransferase